VKLNGNGREREKIKKRIFMKFSRIVVQKEFENDRTKFFFRQVKLSLLTPKIILHGTVIKLLAHPHCRTNK
jgi:hypothetical protein